MFGTGWNTGGIMQQDSPPTPATKPVRPQGPPLGARAPGFAPPGMGQRPVRKPPIMPTGRPIRKPRVPPLGPITKPPVMPPGPVTKPWSQAGNNFDFLKIAQGQPPETPAPPPVAGPPETLNPPTPGFVPGSVSGVQTHHNMFAGANRGQVRTNPQTGRQEIFLGTGQGGESYAWRPYDPNDYGQKQNADLFARYGSNWSSGSGATSMHAPDIAQVLREQLGREPTWQETYDIYYGVNRSQPGIPYNWG